MTVDRYSWGFRRNMIFEDVLDMKELLYQLVSTVRLANIIYSYYRVVFN